MLARRRRRRSNINSTFCQRHTFKKIHVVGEKNNMHQKSVAVCANGCKPFYKNNFEMVIQKTVMSSYRRHFIEDMIMNIYRYDNYLYNVIKRELVDAATWVVYLD